MSGSLQHMEVNQQDLAFEKEIGSGEFGQEGEWSVHLLADVCWQSDFKSPHEANSVSSCVRLENSVGDNEVMAF